MQIGSKVKWTTNDDTVVGILQAFDGKRYTINPGNCTMEFPVGDGVVEPYLGAVYSAGLHEHQTAALTQLVGRAQRPMTIALPVGAGKSGAPVPTKASRAMGIYRSMVPGASRTDIIAAFMSQLDMTLAGAATYYANCKTALSREAH